VLVHPELQMEPDATMLIDRAAVAKNWEEIEALLGP
jgi:hypothetical protein